ncbi:MAG: electron transfer flavoprotein subunit beta/FixA family protein [Thermodesulfobacteriota bacterium]
MDIVVCIKYVPETADISWDHATGTLRREAASGMLNHNDKHAIEAALQLREAHGGSITAVSMGPPQAEDALREALSMDVDTGVLISDPALAGADTLSTAYVLSLALKKMAGFDLIICGKETSDGMTGQVGPQIAEFLGIPQLTYATEISIRNRMVRAKQKLEAFMRTLEAPLPALITVEKELNRPRIPSMDRIMEAYREKEITLWSAKDLLGTRERFGLKGSPTQIKSVYTKELKRGTATILEGEPDELAGKLINILKLKGLL